MVRDNINDQVCNFSAAALKGEVPAVNGQPISVKVLNFNDYLN